MKWMQPVLYILFSVQEKTDKIIAQELQEKEKMISAETEKKEFQQLQVNEPPHDI